MSATCFNDVPGIGELCREGNGLQGIYGLVFADPDFEFTAASNFATLSDWTTGISGGQLFPVMGIKEDEDTTPDDVIWEGPYGDKVHITEGRYAKTYRLHLTLEQHKRLREYMQKKWKVFKIDRGGNLRGTLTSDNKVVGFDISFLRVGKMADAVADTPALTPIMIEEADPKQWNDSGIYLTPSWLPSEEIVPLTEVDATPGSITSNVFDVVVSFTGGYTDAGAANTIAITGLEAANFVVKNSDGLTLTPNSVTESATVPGTYEIDCTDDTISSGTVQVIASSTALYRSDVEAVS